MPDTLLRQVSTQVFSMLAFFSKTFPCYTAEPKGIKGHRGASLSIILLEASKGGMKVGRIKDPLYKDSYFGITPPTFIPPFEAPEILVLQTLNATGARA